MKIEIEKSEYDRLKSREEKLMAYYGWFVDKENDLATVEDIVNENIELRNTLEDVYKAKRELGMEKVRLKALSKHKTEMVMKLGKIKDELEKENKKLKEYNGELIENHKKDIAILCAENKKLKDDVDFYYKSAKQFREDAESWRKECERLLGLQICGKTIAERIEDDKKVVRE